MNPTMEEPYEQQNDRSVDYAQPQRVLRLTDMLYAIRKRLGLILVCALVGLAVGVLLSVVSYMRGEMSKQYAITSAIAVTRTACLRPSPATPIPTTSIWRKIWWIP